MKGRNGSSGHMLGNMLEGLRFEDGGYWKKSSSMIEVLETQ
jgi:hypothetical protein